MPPFATLFPILLAVTPGPLALDPRGVLPLILDEGVRTGPVIATSPFRVEWRDGLLCVGDARSPAPNRCVEFEAGRRGVTVRRLGREGLLVVRAPAPPAEDVIRPPPGAAVVVMSARGVVFAAEDVLDVHLHDDAVDVGLRCDATIPTPADWHYCPVHRYGAEERLALRVVQGALVIGAPRTGGTEDGKAAVTVLVDGRKAAWFVDNGLWESRMRRGEATWMWLNPDADDVEDAGIEGPMHVTIVQAHLDARGIVTATLTDDPRGADNRANFERWRVAPPRIVRGMSPAEPLRIALGVSDVCPVDQPVPDDNILLHDARCGRQIRLWLWERDAFFFADELMCHMDLTDDRLGCAAPGVTLTWTGRDGSDACSTLWSGACATATP